MEMNDQAVLIVGAGMAGLTAAAYLARNHYPVLLLDRNERTGGLLGSVEKNGFIFDTGPRALVNSGIIQPALKDLGIQWDFFKNRISIGVEGKMQPVSSMEDLPAYQEMLLKLYPENAEDVKKIVRVIGQISEYTRVLYEFDNPSFSNLMGDKDYVFKQLLPWLPKFLAANARLNRFNMPMEVFMRRLTDNTSLIDIITQHFFKQTPTYFALGYFYVYQDYFYPRGGTGALGRLLTEKVLSLGVNIQLNTNVVEVRPSENRVIDANGVSYPYRHLLWAADLKTFYRILNPAGLTPQVSQKLQVSAQKVLSSRAAESVFMVNMAVNRPPEFFRERGSEHGFFTPSKQGLGATGREAKERLLQDFERLSKDEVLGWLDQYLRLNTYEVSIPVLRDPAMAPPGQTGVMVSCLLDYQVFKKVEEAGWYNEFKDIVENKIVDLISQTLYPGIREDILFKVSASPITIQKVSGNSEGAIVGWSFEQEPPVIYKLSDLPKSVQTPVPNIYQAGQWAYAPAGVPTAILTGWYAFQRILKRSKKDQPQA